MGPRPSDNTTNTKWWGRGGAARGVAGGHAFVQACLDNILSVPLGHDKSHSEPLTTVAHIGHAIFFLTYDFFL